MSTWLDFSIIFSPYTIHSYIHTILHNTSNTKMTTTTMTEHQHRYDFQFNSLKQSSQKWREEVPSNIKSQMPPRCATNFSFFPICHNYMNSLTLCLIQSQSTSSIFNTRTRVEDKENVKEKRWMTWFSLFSFHPWFPLEIR